MKEKRTAHNSTHQLEGGGFIHIDRQIVPIGFEVECHSCGANIRSTQAALDEGDIYFCWPCVKKWESENKQCFFTGKPK